MSLKNEYSKVKSKKKLTNIRNFFVGLVMMLVMCVVGCALITVLWNFVAPSWGLPNLSIIKMAASIILVFIFKYLFFNTSVKAKTTTLRMSESSIKNMLEGK